MGERTSFMLNAEETKKKNNELIEQLKRENRELKKIRDEIVANRKAAFTAGLSKTTGTSFFDTKDEVYWKRKYDDMSTPVVDNEQEHIIKEELIVSVKIL